MNEHAVLVTLWLGTGTLGLVCGILSVAVAKRRIRANSATSPPAQDEEVLVA